MKIIFTGGGTGGHVIPIVAIVQEIKKIYKEEDLQLFFVGPKDKAVSAALAQEGVKVKTVLAGKVRRYLNPISLVQNIFDVCFKIPMGTLQSFFHLFFLSPDLIFSKGGFGSIPVVFAGKVLFIPIFLHESDIVPGLANQILRGLALEIFTSFPKTECFSSKKLLLLGNPLRKNLLEGDKEEAKKIFKITSDKPIILILGGSQGAQRINDKILEVLPQLLEDFEIIHQCGKRNYETVKAEAGVIIDRKMEASYHLYSFLNEKQLCHAYAVADLIISRAGAGSIFEIAANGKPSILIPLPESAQNHQLKNAYAYEENEATIVIEENNFMSHFFLEKLKSLFNDRQKLEKMSERAREFSKPEAARIIANYLIEYLTG